MKKVMLMLEVFIASVVLPILNLHSSKVTALSVWASGVSITEEAHPGWLVNGGNLECEYFTLKSKYVYGYTLTNGEINFTDSVYEGPGATYPDVCMAQNDNGLVGMGFWAKDGNINETMPIDAGTYGTLPVPGVNTTLLMTPAPTYGTQYSINHNLHYIGYAGVKLIGSGLSQRSEKVWKIDTTKMEQFLSYSDGQVVRIDQVGFSNNGRFMVAQLSRRGVVLIDLQTKKMTPFSPNTITNGINMYMNVSNDGRFVAVYSSAGLVVHDVSGCTTSYEYGQWPSGGALQSDGCVSANYFADVRAAYPLVTDINRVRFAPNGGSLNIDISWRANGELVTKRLRLNANGYVSTARGYLAMGDSYSSGEGDTEGDTWYEPGTDEQGDIDTFAGRNLCHLSRRSYPYLMAVELGYLSNNATTPPADGLFHSVACSGAKIHNVIGAVGEKQNDGGASDFAITDNQYRYDRLQPNALFLPGTNKQTDLLYDKVMPDARRRKASNPEVITLGIAGNDVGFGNFISDCVLWGTCEIAQPGTKKSTDAVTRIAQNHSRLVSTYKKLKLAAPESRVYVHGYPKIIEGSGGYCDTNVWFNDQERLFIENVTHYLNEVVKAAASEAGVVYVDVENIFDRQKLCSGVEQKDILMNGVTAGNDIRPLEENSLLAIFGIEDGICIRACVGLESYHPKPEGFVKYKDAILAQTNDLTLPMPIPVKTAVPVPSIFFGADAVNQVIDLNARNGFPAQKMVLHEDMITGFDFSSKTMSAIMQALAPNSPVKVIVESTPQLIGTYMTDANGFLSSSFILPPLEAGYHELHFIGKDPTGQEIDFYQPFILGVAENDFDGDGVLDAVDSCAMFTNSGIDIDQDGVDDVCDESPVALLLPPQAPGSPDLVAASDSGVSQDDNLTNDVSPTFTVACTDAHLVTIYNGDAALGSAVCSNGVAAITSVDLDDGTYEVTAKQADQSSISSLPSGVTTILIGTQPPSAPEMPDLADSSDTGQSNTDNQTSDPTPAITGVCTGEEEVRMLVDELQNTKTTCFNGTYSANLQTLGEGSRSITAQFIDKAGNVSMPSPALVISVAPDVITPPDNNQGCRPTQPANSGVVQGAGVAKTCILIGRRVWLTISVGKANTSWSIQLEVKTPKHMVTVKVEPRKLVSLRVR